MHKLLRPALLAVYLLLSNAALRAQVVTPTPGLNSWGIQSGVPACVGQTNGYITATYNPPVTIRTIGTLPNLTTETAVVTLFYELLDGSQNVLATSPTVARGFGYNFAGLGEGTYYVRATYTGRWPSDNSTTAPVTANYTTSFDFRAKYRDLVVVPAVLPQCNLNSQPSKGSIQLYVPLDNGGFTYAWSNGATTRDISNLDPADYTVTLTAPEGCSWNFTYGVTTRGLNAVAYPLTGSGVGNRPLGITNGNANGDVLAWDGTASKWVPASQTLTTVANLASTSANVGIGTSSPLARLQVASLGDNTAPLAVSSAAGQPLLQLLDQSGAQAVLQLFDSPSTPDVQLGAGGQPTYFNGGNVGIGTASPLAPFHVTGDALFNGSLAAGGNVLFSGIQPAANRATVTPIGIDASGKIYRIPGSGACTDADGFDSWQIGGNNLSQTGDACRIGTNNPQPFYLETSNARRFEISAGGGVGIPLVLPWLEGNAKLMVYKNISYVASSNDFDYTTTPTQDGLLVGVPSIGTSGTRPAIRVMKTAGLQDDGTTFTVMETGNVGIGVSSPAAALHVVGTSYLNGSLGIGTATPAAPLHVAGNAQVDGLVKAGTAFSNLGLSINGASYLGGRVSLGNPSAPDPLTMQESFSVYGDARMNGQLSAGPRPTSFVVDAGGNVKADQILTVGQKIGIGTSNPQAALYLEVSDSPIPDPVSVNERAIAVFGRTTSKVNFAVYNTGYVFAKRVRVESQNPWPDYVFEPGYQRMTLAELGAYIDQNGHLPGMPSAAEVQNKGIDLGETQTATVRTVEELTLHVIELEKQLKTLAKRLEECGGQQR